MTMEVANVLERAADLIEPEGRWTQNMAARNAKGSRVDPHSGDAVCFCALGAIFHNRGGRVGADDFFGRFVSGDLKQDWSAVGGWNDHPARAQAEVVAKLREAAALARKDPA